MTYEEWKNQIKPDKKKRAYQHIDDPVDLDDPKSFQKITRIIENIKAHQFLPFIKRNDVKIRFRKSGNEEAKRSVKIRPIMYASHTDAHIYSYFNFVILDKYERLLNSLGITENVIAYRKIKNIEDGRGKSNIHFAKEVFDHISTREDCVVVTQDIEGFFDNLSHRLLKEKLCKVCGVQKLNETLYKVFRSLTAHKYIEHDDFVNKRIKSKTKHNKYAVYKILKDVVRENKTNKGIPQGSPISGLLANIYMLDFDSDIKNNFPEVYYRRYSDDLIFVCSQEQKDSLINFINEKIKLSLLSINAAKSFITYFKKSGEAVLCDNVTDGLGNRRNRNYVDYLGLEFTGNNTLLRKNTVQKLRLKQIKKSIRQLSNNVSQIRQVPRKFRNSSVKGKNNYFKRTLEVINHPGVKKQVMNIVRSRNRIKKRHKAEAGVSQLHKNLKGS